MGLSLYGPASAAVAVGCELTPSTAEAAACEVLRQHNTRVVPREAEVHSDQIFTAVLAAWNAPAPAKPLAAATASFFGFFQQRMSAYPDTHAMLDALRARGLPLGILTDVPYGMPAAFVRRDLEAAGTGNYFEAVITSVEVGWRKPSPVGYATLAEWLGTEAAGPLYVGNEAKDMPGARRASARAVFLDHAGSGADYGQHLTITV